MSSVAPFVSWSLQEQFSCIPLCEAILAPLWWALLWGNDPVVVTVGKSVLSPSCGLCQISPWVWFSSWLCTHLILQSSGEVRLASCWCCVGEQAWGGSGLGLGLSCSAFPCGKMWKNRAIIVDVDKDKCYHLIPFSSPEEIFFLSWILVLLMFLCYII